MFKQSSPSSTSPHASNVRLSIWSIHAVSLDRFVCQSPNLAGVLQGAQGGAVPCLTCFGQKCRIYSVSSRDAWPLSFAILASVAAPLSHERAVYSEIRQTAILSGVWKRNWKHNVHFWPQWYMGFNFKPQFHKSSIYNTRWCLPNKCSSLRYSICDQWGSVWPQHHTWPV